jgi:hypothetical protein
MRAASSARYAFGIAITERLKIASHMQNNFSSPMMCIETVMRLAHFL